MLTVQDYQTILDLCEPGEIPPEYALLASRLSDVTPEDIAWAQGLKMASTCED